MTNWSSTKRTSSRQNQLPIGNIYFPRKLVTITTFTPHEMTSILRNLDYDSDSYIYLLAFLTIAIAEFQQEMFTIAKAPVFICFLVCTDSLCNNFSVPFDISANHWLSLYVLGRNAWCYILVDATFHNHHDWWFPHRGIPMSHVVCMLYADVHIL